MWVDPGNRESRGIQPTALKGFDVKAVRGPAPQRAIGIHLDHDSRDFQKRIGRGVKSAGLDIDDHRQKASEASCHEARCRKALRHQLSFVHAYSPSPLVMRQAIRSPARSGTISAEPNG